MKDEDRTRQQLIEDLAYARQWIVEREVEEDEHCWVEETLRESTDQYRIKAVDEILAKADPEDVELHARAYNTKGTALRKTGRTKEALLAFLHVDVLYFAVPEAHAEALANLAELWNELNRTERAMRARDLLESQYANSPWARQGGS